VLRNYYLQVPIVSLSVCYVIAMYSASIVQSSDCYLTIPGPTSSRFQCFIMFVTFLLCPRLQLSPLLFLGSQYIVHLPVSIVSLSVYCVNALVSASIVSSSVCFITTLFLKVFYCFIVYYVTILFLQGFHCFIICLLRHCSFFRLRLSHSLFVTQLYYFFKVFIVP